VRVYAKERNLQTAEKPESYDICFVPDGDYAKFVERQLNEKPASGPIVNREGKTLGTHQGLLHYTVGQRRGLGVASNSPLYVLEVKPETNTLVVGGESELRQSELTAEQVNWVSISAPTASLEALARIRYHALEAPARLAPISGNSVRVAFHEPQKAITPGQSVVFYDGDKVLGGGIIN